VGIFANPYFFLTIKLEFVNIKKDIAMNDGTQPDRPLQLVIIRHAKSARNEAKKGNTYFADEEARKMVKGVADYKIELTQEGIEQALATGQFLRDKLVPPDFIYHSGYRRTIDTMNLVLKAFPRPVVNGIGIRMHPHIRERDPGFTYDMTTEEAEKHFPFLKEYWQTHGGFFAKPPGGESLCDVAQRIRSLLQSLKDNKKGKRVWIFTHGGTIRAFRFVLERWDYDRALSWPPGESPKNCGITIYDYDQKTRKPQLVEYNTIGYNLAITNHT
jgi:broad specificity phosphatase PhoE